MKKQKKARRSGSGSFTDYLRKAFVEKGTTVLSIIVILLVVYMIGRIYVERSNYFKLRSVETRSIYLDQRAASALNSQVLNLYKGFNIFSINLKSIAYSIQRTYPDARNVSVWIVMPDKLVMSLRFRKPVAIVRDSKLYPIDDEGFVLPSFDASSLRDLPIIDGVSIKYDERKGKKSSSENLKLALDLLREIKRSRFMYDCGLDRIDARDPQNLSFYIKSGIEVKIGSENFEDRLDELEKTIKDPRLLLDKIQYIDVRYKDVVIGPK